MATTTNHGLPENLAGDDNNESPEATKPTTGATTSLMHLGRAVYVVITAGSVGAFVWAILNQRELLLIKKDFRGLADEAHQLYARRLDTLRMAAATMAKIAAVSFPSESDWPNIWIEGFSSIAQESLENLESLFLAPLVTPEQKPSFLAFAEDMYDQQTTDDTEIRSRDDGDEYYSVGPNATMIDILDYITNTNTTEEQDDAGSPYNGLWVPVLQHSPPNGESFFSRLRNLHVHPRSMRIVDAVLECTSLNASSKKDCSDTGLLYPPPLRKGEAPSLNLEPATEHFDPSVAVLAPVLLVSDDPSSLVGFTAGMVSWREILEVMFPTRKYHLQGDMMVGLEWVDDLEVVDVFTARVPASEDQIEFVNPDRYNPDLRYMYSKTDWYDLRMANAGSASIFVTVYPCQNYIDSMRTMAPLLSGLWAAGIVVLGSLLFFAGSDGCWCCCYPFRSSARGKQAIQPASQPAETSSAPGSA